MSARLGICTAAICFLAPVQAMEFIMDSTSTGTITLQDGAKPVLRYNFGDQLPAGVDPRFIRSGYLHPVWAPDGTVLTEDFPSDHFHHHGVFWGWPIVKTRGFKSDNWMYGKPPIRQHFKRWVEKTSGTESATLGVENVWLLNDKEAVAKEQLTITGHQVKNGTRAIDVKLVVEAVGSPLTLQGSQEVKKGYGGFSWRVGLGFKGSRISTSTGVKDKDVVMDRAKWMALTGKKNGAAIFVAPTNPDFPKYSFARNSYTGFMNSSWPGLDPVELLPGKPVVLQYRLYIHKGEASIGDIEAAYNDYENVLQSGKN